MEYMKDEHMRKDTQHCIVKQYMKIGYISDINRLCRLWFVLGTYFFSGSTFSIV